LVLAPEALRIASFLRAERRPDELEELSARVADAHRRTARMTRAERAAARLPCPLLEDGRCSVYPVRPLVCGGWTSLDVGACEAYWRAPEDRSSAPVYPAQYEIACALFRGVGRGLADAGLEGRPLELNAALAIALARPNAADRWARSLPVFSLAVDPESAPTGEADD
jgi:hypothetical protein